MFWVMDSEMMIDDRPSEPVLMTARTWRDRKDSMEFMTGRTCYYHGMNDRFWRDHISDKDGRRGNIPPNALAALAVPKATFSFAMTVMECVSWVTEDFVWEHEWVTEPNVLWKENDILEALNYDIDVPCPLQWRLLWFSAPSSLDRKFANHGTKIAKFQETVNMAIVRSRLTCPLTEFTLHERAYCVQ